MVITGSSERSRLAAQYDAVSAYLANRLNPGASFPYRKQQHIARAVTSFAGGGRLSREDGVKGTSASVARREKVDRKPTYHFLKRI